MIDCKPNNKFMKGRCSHKANCTVEFSFLGGGLMAKKPEIFRPSRMLVEKFNTRKNVTNCVGQMIYSEVVKIPSFPINFARLFLVLLNEETTLPESICFFP